MLMLVETPRRLHLGLIDPGASLGRRFGSIGVALEGGYRIRIDRSDELRIVASPEDEETVRSVLKRLNGIFETGMNFSIEIERGIPRHCGLGSTTQLTLGVASGVLKLSGVEVEVERLASMLGRGRNSGIGTYAFKLGGFLIDGGLRRGFPPLILREEFPEEWVFLLIIPEVRRGPDEEEERPLMESLRGRSGVPERISHLLLLGLLPAMMERDIESFGRFLTEIQVSVGRHFEDYQGGAFREDLGIVLEFLKENTYGCGQSSWGPCVYGILRKEEYT